MADITNFIAQETFKLAYLKMFPESFSRLKALLARIDAEFEHLSRCALIDCDWYSRYDNDWTLSEIARAAVNEIAYGTDRRDFESMLCYYLEKEEGGGECSNENIKWQKEVMTSLLSIYSEFGGFSYQGPIAIDPYLLAVNFNLYDTLDYLHNLEFLAKRNGNTMTFTKAPFLSKPPVFDKSPLKIRSNRNVFQVPANSISRQEKRVITVPDGWPVKTDDLAESHFTLDLLQPQETVTYSDLLTLQVDLSKPISDEELDRLLCQVRSELSSLQLDQKYAKMLLATTDEELISAYQIPDLTTDDYVTIKNRYKAPLPGLTKVEHAKNYLCGLILLSEHWVQTQSSTEKVSVTWGKPDDGLSLLHRQEVLSARLTKQYGKHGFSSEVIAKGHRAVKKVLKQYLENLKRLSESSD